ncbi:MAG: hypothetical protein ABI672_09395 [Vicinamibacteria bacterium]
MKRVPFKPLAAFFVIALAAGDAYADTPKFKAGDRVEFSANAACLGAQFAIPTKGTILQVNLGTTQNYVFQADAGPGQSPRTMTKPIYSQDCGIRLLEGGGPAPSLDVCPTEEPPGPVSKTSEASEATFKRVIYDRAREIEAEHHDVQRVGMKFELFESGKPYVNRLTGGGLRKDGSPHLLMHDGAPLDAVIYPIKARYAKCIERPTWKRLWLIEENFDCFKNTHNDWACPVGTGDTKFLKQVDLPK